MNGLGGECDLAIKAQRSRRMILAFWLFGFLVFWLFGFLAFRFFGFRL